MNNIISRIPRRSRRILRTVLLLALIGTSLTWAGVALADVEIPLMTTAAFIQTTGRLANIAIGDYRTNDPTDVDGGGGGDVAGAGDNQPHSIFVYVSCQPGRQYSFDLYDPAMDPGTTIDEIRNNTNGNVTTCATGFCDQTNFRLLRLDNSPIYPAAGWQVYTSGTSNDAWTTLTTYTVPANPVPGQDCGTFVLQSWTGLTDPANANYNAIGVNNDDNAWRFRLVGVDNGSGNPFAAENGPDDLPGTGDESWVGLQFTSYQHSSANSCQDFYWYVPPAASNLYMINFDMDNSLRVCYFPPGVGGTCAAAYPGAPVVQGTLSVNTTWNDAAPPMNLRPAYANMSTFDSVGDFAGDAIAAPGNGIWRAQLCVNANNQYSLEVPGYPVFLQEPLLPSLIVAKTDGTAVVAAPGSTTYTITITNTGPGAAMPVAGPELVDTLPPGMTATACAVNAPLVGTCTGVGTGTVNFELEAQSATVPAYLPSADNAPNNTGTVTVTADIAEGAVGPLLNTAAVEYTDIYGNDHPSVSAEDEDQIGIDLELTKSVTPPNPQVGDTVTYTVTVYNVSSTTATNVQITETLPPQVTLLTAVPSIGTWAAPVWSIPALAGGESATLIITASVDASGEIVNLAEVTAADQQDADSSPGNCAQVPEDDCATGRFVIGPQADLSLTKDVDDTSPAVGDTITYTLTIANAGPDTADNVTVTDVWTPASALSNIITTPSQGTVTVGAGTLTWDVGTLNAGSGATLTITATYEGPAGVTNVAEVTSSSLADPDSTPGNGVDGEDDQADVTIGAPPVQPTPTPTPGPTPTPAPGAVVSDPALSKAGEPQVAAIGEVVTWTITVSNPTGAAITGVVVTDPIPDMFEIIGVTATRGTASFTGQLVTVEIGTLQSNESVTITVTTVARDTAPAGEVCNTAYRGTVSASDCVTLLPAELPETGGRPLSSPPAWLWLLLGAGVLVAGGLGWRIARRGPVSGG